MRTLLICRKISQMEHSLFVECLFEESPDRIQIENFENWTDVLDVNWHAGSNATNRESLQWIVPELLEYLRRLATVSASYTLKCRLWVMNRWFRCKLISQIECDQLGAAITNSSEDIAILMTFGDTFSSRISRTIKI